MKPWVYDLQVWLAKHLLPKDSSPSSIHLDLGIGHGIDVALCQRTPYYFELKAKLQAAKAFWGLTDEALKPYEIRLVPGWFSVITNHEPWVEKQCMGVVAMDVREIRVSLRGDVDEDNEWERTLVHEFGHVYCHEHPELGVAWDPTHLCAEVWDKSEAYHFDKP